MVEQGCIQAGIARALGVTPAAVRAWAVRRGIALPANERASTDVRYGCANEDARRLNGGVPLNRAGHPASHYRGSWRAAEKRGIAWEFTFPEWLKVWMDSGKWEQRGRESGQYCMARHGDVGPYRADNVAIITSRENCQVGHINKPRKFDRSLAAKKGKANRAITRDSTASQESAS